MSRRQAYASTDIGLIALLAAAVLSVMFDLSAVRPFFVVAAAVLIPGGAVMTRLRTDESVTEVGLAIGFSVAIVTIGSLILAWTGFWHPYFLGGVMGCLAFPLLLFDAVSLSRRSPWNESRDVEEPSTRRSSALLGVSVLPAAGAVILWALSLNQISFAHLGNGGLLPALPILWFLALAIAVVGSSILTWACWTSGYAVAVYVVAIVIIIYATVPAIAAVPEHAYVYKHIGVTRFIATNGGVDWSVDIYNRWPGFFASAASLSKWAGVGPLELAEWAGPFFAAINALLVASIAKSVSRDVRVAGFAAVVFTLANWVGQNYFAPQAAAFVLDLTLLLIFLRVFTTAPIRGMWRRLIGVVFDRPHLEDLIAADLPWSPNVALVLIVVLDATIVATHQLTPYALLVQLAALYLLGLTDTRGKIALTLSVIITLGYLVPQASFLSNNFGLLHSFDPIGNASNGEDQIQGLNLLQSNAAILLTAALGLLMLISAVRLMVRRAGKQAVSLVVIGLCPLLIIFFQGYGNNVPIRLLLFSFPFWAVLIAMGVGSVPGRIRRVVTATGLVCLVSPLFLQALYGEFTINFVPPEEVAASRYFYANAPAGSVLLSASPEFPGRIGPRYSVMVGPIVDDQQRGTVIGSKRFREVSLPDADVGAVVGKLKQYGDRGFVVFATSGYTYARLTDLAKRGELRKLEEAMAESPKFHLWYRNGDTRIYEWAEASN